MFSEDLAFAIMFIPNKGEPGDIELVEVHTDRDAAHRAARNMNTGNNREGRYRVRPTTLRTFITD